MGKISLQLIAVLICAIVAGFALLHKGLPPTHDGEYHVIRFYEFDKTLRDGNLFPRWAPDLNYGYGIPLFNYVYPLPNYFASFLHLFNISFIDAFKFNMFTAILLAGLFFYLWTKSFFGKTSAMVGSIFYLFSPYLFVDVYIRGSVGEVWAIALFPALLWSVTEFIKGNKLKHLYISALLLGLVIFSHNILALMFFPFFIVYSLILIYLSKRPKFYFLRFTFLTVLGLGFSSIFWLPALSETKFAVGLQIFDYRSNFTELYQLLFPSWGSGVFGGGLDNQMSVQIGIANLIAVFLSIFVAIKMFGKKDKNVIIVIFFIVSFFLTAFLMLSSSLFLWKTVPLMNYFQFPWRFLSLEILICSFLAAAVVSLIKSKFFILVAIILPIVLAIGYAHPAYYMDRTDNYYVTRSNFIDGTNSIGNSFNTLWFNAKKERVTKRITASSKDTNIRLIKISSTDYIFSVFSAKGSRLIINTAYFPGWQASIDGRRYNIVRTKDGLMSLTVPKGKQTIEVSFKNTPIRELSVWISIISLVIIITLGIKTWYIKYKHEDSN